MEITAKPLKAFELLGNERTRLLGAREFEVTPSKSLYCYQIGRTNVRQLNFKPTMREDEDITDSATTTVMRATMCIEARSTFRK